MASFTIPAIVDIGKRMKAAFRAYLPGTDAWIEPNNLSISSKAFSLGLFEAYQRILYLYRQLFASTADGTHLRLRHAAEYGLTPKASSPAAGAVVILQAVGDDGELPTGLQLQRDDGLFFIVTAATPVTPAGATGPAVFVVPVQCTTTGAVTNTGAGAVFDVLPMANVNLAAVTGTVGTAGLGGGADAETDDALRARVLQRKRFTPMCGATSDYVRWALEVAGVTRAFASGFSNQPPAVALYPLFDTTRAYGIPQQADLDVVTAYVNTMRPVTARLFVCAPDILQVDVAISALEVDTPANRAAISAQMASLFAAKAVVSTADAPLLFRRGWIEGAIDRALGGLGFTVLGPARDIEVAVGTLPFLGNVTYS